MSNIDTPKNSPTYPPHVLRMQGKSQTRYSSLKKAKPHNNPEFPDVPTFFPGTDSCR